MRKACLFGFLIISYLLGASLASLSKRASLESLSDRASLASEMILPGYRSLASYTSLANLQNRASLVSLSSEVSLPSYESLANRESKLLDDNCCQSQVCQGLSYGVPFEFLGYFDALKFYVNTRKDLSVFQSFDLELEFEPSDKQKKDIDWMISTTTSTHIDERYLRTPEDAAYVLFKMIEFLRARNPILTEDFCDALNRGAKGEDKHHKLPPVNLRMFGNMVDLAHSVVSVASAAPKTDVPLLIGGFLHQFMEVLFAVKLEIEPRKRFNVYFETQSLKPETLFNYIKNV